MSPVRIAFRTVGRAPPTSVDAVLLICIERWIISIVVWPLVGNDGLLDFQESSRAAAEV